MATQINFQWDPAGGPSLSQTIEYKRKIDPAFGEAVTGLGPEIETYPFSGTFEDNRIYCWRVISNCTGGAQFISPEKDLINLTCPNFTLSKTNNSIGVSFPHLGGDVDQYIIKLYDAAGTNLLDSILVNGSIPATVSETFKGREAGVMYQVRVEVYAGGFSKTNCPLKSETTNQSSPCAVPTLGTATIS